jgi:hypothetical protein
VGTIYRGWVKAKNADVGEGISLLRCGFAAYRASGAELLMHHHTALSPEPLTLLARSTRPLPQLHLQAPLPDPQAVRT